LRSRGDPRAAADRLSHSCHAWGAPRPDESGAPNPHERNGQERSAHERCTRPGSHRPRREGIDAMRAAWVCGSFSSLQCSAGASSRR
jgi:hypothetical protein